MSEEPPMSVQNVREGVVAVVTSAGRSTVHVALFRRDGRMTSAAELLAEEEGDG